MSYRSLIYFLLFFLPMHSFSECISVKKANLRSGPGKNFSKSWEVFKYMPLKVIKKQKKWSQVKDVDGETHWIFNKLITKDYFCAVVKVKKANLRIEPSAKAPRSQIWPTAEKYHSFKLLTRKKEWVRVEDIEGDKYWLSGKLVWVQ